MMRQSKIWGILFATALLNDNLTPLHAQTTPPAHLTQAQAIAIASGFCKAVGAPETGTPTAVYPTPLPFQEQQPDFYAPRWDITFPDQTEVEVVDSLKIVSSYNNNALMRQLEMKNQPAGTLLPQSQAILYAWADLRAAGQITGLAASPTAQQTNLSDPPTTADAEWTVDWQRQYRGIPYKDERATVLLEADTGALEMFLLNCPSPPPTAWKPSVTKTQAEQKAVAQLKSEKIPHPVFQSVTEVVVQPNTFWQTHRGVDPIPNAPGRVVWDCFYTDDRHLTDELWVDTETGAIDGGQWFGLR